MSLPKKREESLNLAGALRVTSSITPKNRLPGGPRSIAFVGAGGKTTALFQLARELPPPVIVTCTTHLGEWQFSAADRHITVDSIQDLNKSLNHDHHGVVLVTGPLSGDRSGPVEGDILESLHHFCKERDIPLLIEADGSRGKPLKAPALHEPNIPEFADLVIVVAGLQGLGKPLTHEFVHRPDLFSTLAGIEPGAIITSAGLMHLLKHDRGGKKNIPRSARHVMLLNQADSAELQAKAGAISTALLPEYHAILTTSLSSQLEPGEPSGAIHGVREPVAGIILAAGAATRYGKPKQLLDWRGEPFVRHIAGTALSAALDPVIIVTGAYASEVGRALADLPVQIAHNPDWKNGVAASIRKGLSCCYPGTDGPAQASPGGAFFLLADQPQLSVDLLNALVGQHTRSLAPVCAPLVDGQRGNPVLFDRLTFPDLMSLEGDTGGRAIFSSFPPTYLPWHDSSMLLDVDRPEDYQRLQEFWE